MNEKRSNSANENRKEVDSRNPSKQHTYVSVLVNPAFVGVIFLFLFQIANSLYLHFSTEPSGWMFASHLLAGTLLVGVLVIFLWSHLRQRPMSSNYSASYAGLAIIFSLLAIVASGCWILIFGTNALGGHIFKLHLGTIIFTLLLTGLHFYVNMRPLENHNTIIRKLAIFLAIIFFGYSIIEKVKFHKKTVRLAQIRIDQTILQPAQSLLNHDSFLDPVSLGGFETCGTTGCHPDIYNQWSSSMHHFSSFNNPYYKRSIDVVLESQNPEAIRWCASCHDPVPLFTGLLNDASKHIDLEHASFQQGITCTSCHAIDHVLDVKGNGHYQLAQPQEYISGSRSDTTKYNLEISFIKARPKPHKTAMSTQGINSTKFCSSCHKVSVTPDLNDYKWKRAQNQYDSWYASSYSGKHPRSFYEQDTKDCMDCHMPLIRSNDEGNDNGYVRSHRFAAANSAMAYLNHDTVQLVKVREFLGDDIVGLDIFKIKINRRIYGPLEKFPEITSGDKVEIEVVVSNIKTGHNLPAGTNDTNEWWLEVTALNKYKAPIYSSGLPDEYGAIDSTAHFFKTILIDKKGNLINKRNILDFYATVSNTTIPSGKAQIIRYSFIAKAESIISGFEVSMKQRKFNQPYNAFTFQNQVIPSIPIMTVSSTTRWANTTYQAENPMWKRWNNYGIGLLEEESLTRAIQAFIKVNELDKKRPDGNVNKAIALLAGGDVIAAEEELTQVLEIFPDDFRTRYFRGKALYAKGEYKEAIAIWKDIEIKYPNDMVLLFDLGRAYYQESLFSKSKERMLKILEIDPEHQSALYNLMLIHTALGDQANATVFKEKYDYYKQNELEEETISTFKKYNPIVMNETLNRHVHILK